MNLTINIQTKNNKKRKIKIKKRMLNDVKLYQILKEQILQLICLQNEIIDKHSCEWCIYSKKHPDGSWECPDNCAEPAELFERSLYSHQHNRNREDEEYRPDEDEDCWGCRGIMTTTPDNEFIENGIDHFTVFRLDIV